MTVGHSLRNNRHSARSLSQSLNERWEELRSRYLPVAGEDPFWRYSRTRGPADPDQGWKLHISATVLTANKVLEAVGPFLQSHGTIFKGPVSLHELSRINCGVYYSYALVGKCFTVYPQTTEEALTLAERLHDLTLGIAAPGVPFDQRFRPNSCVHYRYGAFRHRQINNKDGTFTLALRGPRGKLVPDLRQSPAGQPDWISDPFLNRQQADGAAATDTPLKTTFKVFQALTQRGKGGVYKAVDVGACPPRLCILKEGRRHGEPSWDGCDGYWRVNHEEQVLRSLSSEGVDVPNIFSSFEVEGNFYLAIEFIEGVSLQTLLTKRKRRLPVRLALEYGLQLSRLMAQIHSAGWVWRDCKPSNLIITSEGSLRPLDFEGACLVTQPDPTPWGTPNFVPPEAYNAFHGQSRVPEDLYALGVLVYHLLFGGFPSAAAEMPLDKFRRNVPAAFCQIVVELLSRDPQQRPSAQKVARKLGIIRGFERARRG